MTLTENNRRRPGRPPKKAEDCKRHPLNLRTTARLKLQMQEAAKLSGRSVAQELEYRLERSFMLDEVRDVIRQELSR